MSGLLQGLVFKHAPCDGGTLLTLLALADVANDDGTRIWPSNATLAIKTRQSERNVQRCLEKLTGLGLIKAVERPNGRKGHYGAWEINVARLLACSPGQVIDFDGEKTTGQNVHQDLSTGHSEQGHRTIGTEPPDICASVIDKHPRPILETSCARAAGSAETAVAARVMLAKLTAKLPKAIAAAWLNAVTPGLDGITLVLAFDKPFQRNWVANHYQQPWERALGSPIRCELSEAGEAMMPRRRA